MAKLKQTGIYYLPFETRWGYPQKQRVAIPDTLHLLDIYYFWNVAGFVTMRVFDVHLGEYIFSGKLELQFQEEVRDPETHRVWFWFIPEEIGPMGTRIRIFWPGMYVSSTTRP